jgi:hypothetical protein
MKFLSLANSLALVSAVLSSPVADSKTVVARADDRGTETISGLGARKQAVLNAGGNTRDLAIAMLETLVHLFDVPIWQPSLQVLAQL